MSGASPTTNDSLAKWPDSLKESSFGNSRGRDGVRPLGIDLDLALRSAVPLGAAPLDDAFPGANGLRCFRGGSESGCWG